MNYIRIGRALVCLLLVCCLIVHISPVKAKAVDALSVSFIGAGLAVTTGLVALGLQAGGTSKALQEISGSAVSAIESGQFGEFISDGLVNAVKYNRGDGTYGFALSLGLLEALKTWIFGEGVVQSSSLPFSSQFSFTVDSSSFDVDFGSYEGTVYAVHYTYGANGTISREDFQIIGVLPKEAYFDVLIDGTSKECRAYILNDAGNYLSQIYTMYSYPSNPKVIPSVSGIPLIELGHFESQSLAYAAWKNVDISSLGVSTPYDLTLGEVGTADQTVEEAHPEWVAGSITVPGSLVGSDTEEKYVPVGLPATQEEALGKTQEEVQSGVGTYDDTIADTETDSDTITGTGTIADVIAGIKALPDKIADVFADVIAGVKAIPQVISEALAKAFAISDTFIATKVEALTLKYPYLDTFLALGTDLKAYFLSLGTKPPIIYIDLGAARGSLFWGGRQAFLDLSWYAEYKPTMDAILGGFIWLWLAWRVFLSLPGIISGASGVWGSVLRHSERSTKDGNKEVSE